ncbi:MAG: hypothetical protein IT293_16465 [Deltaproteobacteria bacterium]|nr:hypothetical protein [Deltaproteobacteria bacterium]
MAGSRWSRWFGVERTERGFLLDPDEPKARTGERLIVFIACCEALVLLSAALFGLWLYSHSG